MPELPEVRTVAKVLKEKIIGKKIIVCIFAAEKKTTINNYKQLF